MTRKIALAAVASLAATWALAAEVAPTEVMFEGGAVAASLTGVPGDPEAGAKVMTTASLGNCVACHLIEAMPAVQFPGTIAPALDGAADRWTEAELRGLLVNAKMTFDATFMPAFYKTEGFIRPGDGYTGKAPESDLPPILSAQQIENIVAYLLTLRD
ncbi:sulfur oxidation c-type cytochrome SoxX [Rhodovulum strictum]|uniref:Sulfur oxidation c-type cytochrome SoxX n=1 Tax=Rhodovulum strictum TaxID=58314 RepID=A0A844BA00_9RHOB|nr:sulfur oxidation c-type cytochrome SoxX [Rhodovulum strictum]MRH22410.1 sulfur oxidation c-type cytochrome SoxX [Rhodovulum strictum]